MAQFILIVVVFWAVALGAFFLFSRWFKSSDLDKIKNRLIGDARRRKKDSSPQVALFEPEQRHMGTVSPTLMKKFNLTREDPADLLEQAGLKWNPVKLVHLCLGGFIAGYAVGICFLQFDARVGACVSRLFGAGRLLYVLRLRRARLKASKSSFRTRWSSSRVRCAPVMHFPCRSK